MTLECPFTKEPCVFRYYDWKTGKEITLQFSPRRCLDYDRRSGNVVVCDKQPWFNILKEMLEDLCDEKEAN